jgi:hypothetical protein
MGTDEVFLDEAQRRTAVVPDVVAVVTGFDSRDGVVSAYVHGSAWAAAEQAVEAFLDQDAVGGAAVTPEAVAVVAAFVRLS